MQSPNRYFGLEIRLSISFRTFYCCYYVFAIEHCIEIWLFYFVLYSINSVFLFIWFLCKWVFLFKQCFTVFMNVINNVVIFKKIFVRYVVYILQFFKVIKLLYSVVIYVLYVFDASFLPLFIIKDSIGTFNVGIVPYNLFGYTFLCFAIIYFTPCNQYIF